MTNHNQDRKSQTPHAGTDRRDFMKTSAAAGAGFWLSGGIPPRPSRMAVDEIQFAAIGCGGKGGQDSSSLGKLGQMVALCDIDTDALDKKKNEFPEAKRYFDFRKMLDEMGDKIDAVNISTPDHTHAVATLMAMRKGIHCYTQKPLTHSIEEARLLAKVAKEKEIVTQMGNQGTALSTLRRSAALVKAGVVGDVSEVHVWTNRPVWPQAKGLQVKTESPPDKIKWDLWLGPRPKREFSHEIHPFKWRGFWDFGTGALGDMACHTLNMSFMALDMSKPVSIKAETHGHDGNVFPKWSVIEYTFDIGMGKELKLFWYDGTKMPPRELLKDLPLSRKDKHFESAALIVGDKGRFYSPGDYGGDRQNTGTVIDGEFTPLRRITEPEVEFVKSPGTYKEFAAAIKGEMKTVSNFPDYAGPLTEVVLLGNLAVWEPNKLIKWDAEQMEAEGATPEMKKLIRHEYLNGFSIKA